jgi:hypothetical protein
MLLIRQLSPFVIDDETAHTQKWVRQITEHKNARETTRFETYDIYTALLTGNNLYP